MNASTDRRSNRRPRPPGVTRRGVRSPEATRLSTVRPDTFSHSATSSCVRSEGGGEGRPLSRSAMRSASASRSVSRKGRGAGAGAVSDTEEREATQRTDTAEGGTRRTTARGAPFAMRRHVGRLAELKTQSAPPRAGAPLGGGVVRMRRPECSAGTRIGVPAMFLRVTRSEASGGELRLPLRFLAAL